MNPNDPNVQMLDVVAQRIGDELCGRLVFVGGAVAGLLITDPAQPAIRPTEDVDLLAQVIARAGYYTLEAELHARGFEQDMRMGAPICRWMVNGVTVDVMPTRQEERSHNRRGCREHRAARRPTPPTRHVTSASQGWPRCRRGSRPS